MGKKRREDREGNESYEVWISHSSGRWTRVVERGNDGIFEQKARALAIAGVKSTVEGVVETLVVERRPIASFNGPAISLKGQLRAVGRSDELKKEESIGNDLHGGRSEAGPDASSGTQLERQADPGGSVREAPAGE